MEHIRAIPSGGGHIACVFYLIRTVCYVNAVHGVLVCPLLRTMITSMCVSALTIREADRGSREFFLEHFSLVHLINTRDPCSVLSERGIFNVAHRPTIGGDRDLIKGGDSIGKGMPFTGSETHQNRTPYRPMSIYFTEDFRGVVLLESDSA